MHINPNNTCSKNNNVLETSNGKPTDLENPTFDTVVVLVREV